jgi:hypothetical protein
VLGGIAVGLLLLAAIELVLRQLDRDKGAGLFTAEVRPDGVRVMRLSWNPQFNKPQPELRERSFLADKPPGTFRFFVVGESSAEGVPYGPGLAFSSWLQRRLEAEAPDVRWEVVNAALAGAQSSGILTLVRDIAKHAPWTMDSRFFISRSPRASDASDDSARPVCTIAWRAIWIATPKGLRSPSTRSYGTSPS